MKAYDGVGIANGKIVIFKFKNTTNGLVVSDYRFRIEPKMIEFYIKAMNHCDKILKIPKV
jgi:hypothetical protein